MGANAWARQLPGVQVTVPDDRHVKITGDDIAFTALLDWLATAQAAHGRRVESARIDARPEAGRVKAALSLVR